MIVIDSCVWIEALRQNGDIAVKAALQGILEKDKALLCGPVSLEVLGATRQQMRKKIKSNFDNLPYYRSNDTLWRDAVSLSWTIRDKGLTLPWNDILIANIVMETSGFIYTTDKHFLQLAEFLPIQIYRPGYGGRFNPQYT